MKTCRAPRPVTGDACGETATHLVTFRDGTAAPFCQPCAVAIQQTALSHNAQVKVEPIR